MFKCLGWPFAGDTNLLALRNTWCGNACFGAQVSSKYGTWYSERVILQFMCVGSLAGVTYLHYTVLMSSNKSETAVHCFDPALSVLVMLVSRNSFHVVSAALQSFACKHGIFTRENNMLFCMWKCYFQKWKDHHCYGYIIPWKVLRCGPVWSKHRFFLWNLRKFSENVRKRLSGLRTTFGKSLESVRKSSENGQKSR